MLKNNAKRLKKNEEENLSDIEEEIPFDKIEYNMPKPGPHAKV